jgi:hypothetical protein
MGKAAKEHRLKVLKRNRRMQHEKNKISKEWNVAMQEQMEKLREEFAKMSAETENNLTVEKTDEVETTNAEEQQSTEPVPAN